MNEFIKQSTTVFLNQDGKASNWDITVNVLKLCLPLRLEKGRRGESEAREINNMRKQIKLSRFCEGNKMLEGTSRQNKNELEVF